jgi:hypothetical protein
MGFGFGLLGYVLNIEGETEECFTVWIYEEYLAADGDKRGCPGTGLLVLLYGTCGW